MEKLETSSRERGGRLNSGRIRHCRRTCTSAYFQRACTEHGKRARWRARGVDDGRRGWRWGSAAGGMGVGGEAQTGDETHAENYDAAQLAVRVREIDRRREHTSTM